MPANPRLLRAEADNLDDFTPRYRTARESALREHIVKTSQALLARHGRHDISFAALALALRIGAGTLRRHFIDLDALLGEILSRHLMDLSRHLGEIPFTDPDRERKKRAKYLEYTRTPFGGLTEAHLLFVRDRHTLPEDLLSSLEQTRDGIGNLLGPDPHETLTLLDTPYISHPRIEAMLAALEPFALPEPAEPAEPATEPTEPATQAPEPATEAPEPVSDPAPEPASSTFETRRPLPSPDPTHLPAASPAHHPIPPAASPPPAPD